MGDHVELKLLRAATEKHVERAFDQSYIERPLAKPDELLEFFNRMLDVLTGERET